MTPKRYKQIDEILQQALGRPPDSVESFLREACAGDDELRREVQSLLEHNRQLGSFIDSPAHASTSIIGNRQQYPNLAGRTLSHYRILEKVGEGGMGLVYRAEDIRLKRPVAIKVLPADRVSDPERKRRFVKEARAASALNHPNIVTIYDIDEPEGVNLIAMEYVAGQTLDRQIPKEGIPIGRALRVAIQMADGLAAAHSAGIVHRDFKPANVMASESGQVKILDFGLAKLVESPEPGVEGNASADSRESSFHTEEGMILGTAAYMSPEQAKGQKADPRSDIFSFGAVLYEMVSGQRAFEGESTGSLLAAIIRDEPKPLREIAPQVPGELDRLIHRCLRKEPERRYQAILDVKVELQELQAEIGQSGVKTAAAGRLRRIALWFSTITAGILLAAGAVYWLSSGREAPKGASAVERPLVAVTSGEGLQTDATWSPDGRYIAYAAGEGKNFDILIKEVGGGEPGKLKGADDPEANDWQPDYSPDGKQIVFRSERGGGGLYIVSAPFGGPARHLVSGGYSPRWSPDGRRLLFLESSGRGSYSPRPKVLLLDSLGVTDILKPGGESAGQGAWSVRWHPDGRLSIFDSVGPRFWTQSIDGSRQVESKLKEQVAERVKKLEFGFYLPTEFQWAPSGNALFFVASAEGVPDLWRVEVDPKTLEWLAGPDRLTTSPDRETGLSVSRSGDRLAFNLERTALQFWSFPLDPGGQLHQGERIRLGASGVIQPQSDLSADGRTLAFVTREPRTGARLWAIDLMTGSRTLLAEGDKLFEDPRWSRDGRYLAYATGQIGSYSLFTVPAAGGQSRRLAQDWFFNVGDWFPDGKSVFAGPGIMSRYPAYSSAPPLATVFKPGPRDALRLPEVILAASDRYFIFEARFSPNGRWVSFTAAPYPGPRVDAAQFTHIFVVPASRTLPSDLERTTGLSRGDLELARVLATELHLAKKKSVEQFARELQISEDVIRKDVEHVLTKIKARDLAEASRKLFPRQLIEREWVAITEGESWNAWARWAADGRVLYFVSDRNGSVNVWGRRFDPQKGKPVGDAFQVTKLTGPATGFADSALGWQLGVGPQRMVTLLEEVTGNVWVLENVNR